MLVPIENPVDPNTDSLLRTMVVSVNKSISLGGNHDLTAPASVR